MSPAGWLASSVWYDTLSEPPEPGSPQEAIAQMVFMLRQQAKAKMWMTLYSMQREVPEPALKRARDMLVNSLFPYEEPDEGKRYDALIDREMKRWVGGGPMMISPKGGQSRPTRVTALSPLSRR